MKKCRTRLAETTSTASQLWWIFSVLLASFVVASFLRVAEKGTVMSRKPEFVASDYYDP